MSRTKRTWPLLLGRWFFMMKVRMNSRAFRITAATIFVSIILMLATILMQPPADDGKENKKVAFAITVAAGASILTFIISILGNILSQRYLDWERSIARNLSSSLNSNEEVNAVGYALGACLRGAADKIKSMNASDGRLLKYLASQVEVGWLEIVKNLPTTSSIWIPKCSPEQIKQLLNPSSPPVVSEEAVANMVRLANNGKLVEFEHEQTLDLVVKIISGKFNQALLAAYRQTSSANGGAGIQEQAIRQLFAEVSSLGKAVYSNPPYTTTKKEVDARENAIPIQPPAATQTQASLYSLLPVNDAAWLRGIYKREIAEMAREWSFIFSKFQYLKRLKSISEDPAMASLFTGWSKGFLDHQQELSSSLRNGIGDVKTAVSIINRHGGLKLAISPAHAATLAIFSTLRDEHNLNVQIDFKRAHSVEILRQVKRGELDADGCTLTLATAGSFLVGNQVTKFSPFMLMPGMTHGILAPRHASITELPLDGEYYLMKETAGTEFLVMLDLMRGHPSNKIIATEAEPDVATEALAQGDLDVRSIIGFPHYEFNIHFNNCILLPYTAERPTPSKPIVLFLSAEKYTNKDFAESLQLLVRDTWLRLMQSKESLEFAVNKILSQSGYVDTLFRITGLAANRGILPAMANTSFTASNEAATLLGHFFCRHASLDEIISLRHAVLRPQLSPEDSVLPGDHAQTTRHYGVFNAHGRAIGCVSMMQSEWEGQSAWQLRAMAVAEPYRSNGIGSTLIKYIARDIATYDLNQPIWCNARVSAREFYQKHGWKAVTGDFSNGVAGLSVKMLRTLGNKPGAHYEHIGAIS